MKKIVAGTIAAVGAALLGTGVVGLTKEIKKDKFLKELAEDEDEEVEEAEESRNFSSIRQ